MYRTLKAAATPKPDFVIALTKDQNPPATGDVSLDTQIKRLAAQPPFTADAGQTLLVTADKTAGRAILVGLGAAEDATPDTWRRAAAAALRSAFAARMTALRWVNPDHPAAIGDGLALANFTFETFLGKATQPDTPDKPIDLKISLNSDQKATKSLREALTLGECVATARTLAATPPNIANPAYIASFSRNLAKRTGLKCTIIDHRKAKELKLGGLLAVGSGSATPPCMIRLEWCPTGKTKQAPVLVVGKAVTFDTGGYSLKSNAGKGMKYDKCGGMTVIGIMEAAARLKLKQRVVGLIPCAENMIDRNAYRVDDILRLANGVTCEVTNTDAEGRLILADALAHGTKHEKPRVVFDLATLTGGVVVALGPYYAGLYATDDQLAEQLKQAGETTGEKIWRLPLDHDIRKLMKSKHADLVNSAPQRWAHPGQGAAFLSYFVGQDAPTKLPTLPWAHLDIAGTATTDNDSDLHTQGPTGFGVRLITEWLQNH